MKIVHNKYYYNFLQLAAEHISQAVNNSLPDEKIKAFMLWLLKNDNPQQENYLRMLGVAGSIELELKLFSEIISPSVLNKMTPYISVLNAYFAYETLSDNLGVGLAASAKNTNPVYPMQKEILLHFNRVMIEKIKGAQASTYELLTPIAGLVEQISVSQKTLAPQQMQLFIAMYAEHNKEVSSHLLEHSFLAILLLNSETCLQLLASMQNSPIYPLLKESLIARYDAVNHIIQQSSQASWQTLADWGLNSILTVPTLAYCIGALHEVKPCKNFKTVIDNGLLYSAMADGALLVRLLNDVGTHLLRMNASDRSSLYEKLKIYRSNDQFDSIFAYLHFLSSREELFLSFARIRKDLQHGEFNICLDSLANQSSIAENLYLFCQNIDYSAELYQQKYQILSQKLTQLSTVLGNEQASKIILHFVQFHEYKYSFEFESPRGDYAITREQ